MNRSVTRGLSVSAVSALAVTGLSLVSAPAQAAVPEVELLSQFTGVASLRYDTTGTGTRLTARVDSPDTAVTFQVNRDPEAAGTDPGWRDLEFVGGPTAGHYVSWGSYGTDASGRSFRGERVALRAAAQNADGTSYSVRNNVEVTDEDGAHSVSIGTAGARYFLQPYADSDRTSATIPVDGSTSATSGTVDLSTWRDDRGAFVGQTAAAVQPFDAKVPGTNYRKAYGRFAGLIELTPYDISEGAVAVAAERGSDDVAPIALTAQRIASVEAFSVDSVRPGEQGDVAVYVNDVDHQRILGAEVRRLSDSSLVGYTDRNGRVTATQTGDTTEEYYANATDGDAFSSDDGDVSSGPVTATTYEPVASSVEAVLGDGTVFDVDEYQAGDLALLVRDDRGRPVDAGESVSYTIQPSDEAGPATYRTAITNADGVAVADFDPAGARGDYTLSYVLTSREETEEPRKRTFTTGEAELLLSPKADAVEQPAGGQIDYFGRLVIDGEPLVSRRVDLRYTRGVEVVPGNRPDAGIVTEGRRVLRTSAVTNPNGSFRFTVDDAAETPQASEIDGVLSASTGDNVPTDESTVDGNADTGASSTTRFGSGRPGTAAIALDGDDNGARADRLTVTGPRSIAGETIEVFRVNARGKRFLVKTKPLNRWGDRHGIVVADGNGRARTTYVARLVASQRVKQADSNTQDLR